MTKHLVEIYLKRWKYTSLKQLNVVVLSILHNIKQEEKQNNSQIIWGSGAPVMNWDNPLEVETRSIIYCIVWCFFSFLVPNANVCGKFLFRHQYVTQKVSYLDFSSRFLRSRFFGWVYGFMLSNTKITLMFSFQFALRLWVIR